MSSDITNKIKDDLKSAMKSRDKKAVSAIRLILASIKQKEVDSRKEIDDPEVLTILGKLAKQRKDSIAQYENASRNDLASIETHELEIINSYLPKQLSETEVKNLVVTAIKEIGAQGPKDIGKVMGKLKEELRGKADMGLVSRTVKECL